jgi:signal transduction histidine kinase
MNNKIYLAVEVSDTGKGLSDNEHQHLFNRFTQASPKTHIEYGGSGLGLFISRQITEMMEGQIGIRHGQQIGCTFVFFVQTQRVVAENQENQESLAAATDILLTNVTHHPVSLLSKPFGTPSAQSHTPRSVPAAHSQQHLYPTEWR